ncbi:hypothetical protein ACNKHT_21835 [Shigella flexneri]
MKFGVSGCTRECSEAQGKDVGIIATEKGWNLYVCGNGGMKPRHADLLAADIDCETLIGSSRPLHDVLHPYRRQTDAYRAVVRKPRRRHRLSESGDH